MTAPTDAGQTWYRWRARWRASRWHPTRLLSTGFRRSLAVLVLLWLPTMLEWVAGRTADGPWWWLGLPVMLLYLYWIGMVIDTWDRQVRAATKAPRTPPEPLNTWIFNADYDPGSYEPHVIAGWEQVSADVVQHARNMGLDVDDPYTLAVLVAGATMPKAYELNRPVTLEGAVSIHADVWKVRARDLARWAEQDTDAP